MVNHLFERSHFVLKPIIYCIQTPACGLKSKGPFHNALLLFCMYLSHARDAYVVINCCFKTKQLPVGKLNHRLLHKDKTDKTEFFTM